MRQLFEDITIRNYKTFPNTTKVITYVFTYKDGHEEVYRNVIKDTLREGNFVGFLYNSSHILISLDTVEKIVTTIETELCYEVAKYEDYRVGPIIDLDLRGLL